MFITPGAFADKIAYRKRFQQENIMKLTLLTLAILGLVTTPALASEEKTVDVRAISENGIGDSIGHVLLRDSENGLVITPSLKKLAPGAHGFHIHQKPSCETEEKDGKKVAGGAAGGHYDPGSSGKHEGPEGHGHHGDLPALLVNDAGVASQPMVAPRLKLADVKGRALMIHAGGDNYSDQPKPLGGGGARVACGVIE
jgi:Cu-Zn family superoxide dismutase